MRDFDIRELQLKELDILKEVDRICKKHDIKYFLSWGSVLGAIRHKGFIPWDDDIDISMYYNDYKKFNEICKKELDEKFFLQSTDSDENYWEAWNKIRINNTVSMLKDYSHINCHWGICIDLFPIYNVPNKKLLQLYQNMFALIYRILCMKPLLLNMKVKGKKNILKNILKIIPNGMIKLLKNFSLKQISIFENKNTYLCGEILSMGYKDSIFKKDVFNEGINMKFEGEYYPIPYKYDEYLKQAYGDYMKLPKEEERIGHGNIIVEF